MRVCLIQFIKCAKGCGELKAAERFPDLMDVHVLGAGFTWQSEDLGGHRHRRELGASPLRPSPMISMRC